jgi:hypothetical protein
MKYYFLLAEVEQVYHGFPNALSALPGAGLRRNRVLREGRRPEQKYGYFPLSR